MEKVIITFIFLAFVADGCGQTNNNHANNDNMTKEAQAVNADYVKRHTETGIEYRKDNILYIFQDGALTTIEQLDWGDADGMPLSYVYSYSDTPKEIIYTTKSGDKSQSETYVKITLEKTIFKHQYHSKDGRRIREYEASTLLDTWIRLSETFEWKKFSALKSDVSEMIHDGMDKTISVVTPSGTSSVTNYRGDELQGFFKIISDYHSYLDEMAEKDKIIKP